MDENSDMIARVVETIRRMQEMDPGARELYLTKARKRQRRRICAFCKKHPEKCLP